MYPQDGGKSNGFAQSFEAGALPALPQKYAHRKGKNHE
jgi:hypothetical protein